MDFSSIPVIDIGPILQYPSNDVRFLKAAESIDLACRNVGFFYIVNHGIPQEKTQGIFKHAHEFFDLPIDMKRKVAIGNSPNHRGYFGIGEEYLDESAPDKDLKEGIDLGIDLPSDDPDVMKGTPNYGSNQWPEGLDPSWKHHVNEYIELLLSLGRSLMKAFAINLKVEENYFEEMYRNPMVIFRMLKYPPYSTTHRTSEKQLGCGAHTDYGFLTILAQDTIGGLQVKNSKGEWVDATPIENSFVVNLGDMMARATNDIYKATPHRVMNSPSENCRISIPFFFDPAYYTHVECFESCRKENTAPKYPPVVYGDHLLQRLNATFSYRQND
eukprot:TRINITY_DN7801_c0_g1_i1.p1 TRINITY_DN7801_c0_g1~~TRINITY_DN7801_c0_g1_i1.p1  ORF type:complete len:329 (+),score=39.95 TRINITY_DN7801_c0_g1_i1:44-1030(+)